VRALQKVAIGGIGIQRRARCDQARDCRAICSHRLSQPKQFARVWADAGGPRRGFPGTGHLLPFNCFDFRINCFILRIKWTLPYELMDSNVAIYGVNRAIQP
jgi:hypothetical protein